MNNCIVKSVQVDRVRRRGKSLARRSHLRLIVPVCERPLEAHCWGGTLIQYQFGECRTIFNDRHQAIAWARANKRTQIAWGKRFAKVHYVSSPVVEAYRLLNKMGVAGGGTVRDCGEYVILYRWDSISEGQHEGREWHDVFVQETP